MALINEVIKKYKAMSYDQLLERARADYGVLLPVFSKLDKSGNGKPYVVIFMGSALAADGKFTDKEYKFVNDLLGLSYEDACNFVEKHLDPKAASISDKLFDLCNDGLKELLLDLCLCFVAVDDNVNAQETAFIARLLV